MSVPTIQVLPAAQPRGGGPAASNPTAADGSAFARALERATTERTGPRTGTDSGRGTATAAGQSPATQPEDDASSTVGTQTPTTGNAEEAAGTGAAGTAQDVATLGLPGPGAAGTVAADVEVPGFSVLADSSDLPGEESLAGATASENSSDEAANQTPRAGDSAGADLSLRTASAATADAANASAMSGNSVTGTAASSTAANGADANRTNQQDGTPADAPLPVAGSAAETGDGTAAGAGQHNAPEQDGQPAAATAPTTAATAAAASAASAVAAPVADVVPGAPAAPTPVFTDAISGTTAAQPTEAAGNRGAPQPQPLAEQMRAPLLNLREAGAGEHTLTLRVEPERLGPVQVRAHIGADGIRIELVGATDIGRDGLKAILTDLRRDLAAAGMNARLDVNSDPDSTFGDQNPTGDPDGQEHATGPQAAVANPSPTSTADHRANLTQSARTSDASLRGGVDILA